MAVDRPLPPFLPETEAQFLEHASADLSTWFRYFQSAYEYIEEQQGIKNALENELARERVYIAELNENFQSAHLESQKLRTIVDFQKSQYSELESKLRDEVFQAKLEAREALRLAQPAVQTPPSLPTELQAKEGVDPLARTPAPLTTPASSSTRLSERVPDPDKFSGDKADLRRFVNQITQKLTVNYDRFPNADSRLTYVQNRLKGAAYDQVAPYMRQGLAIRPTDFQGVLDILERAYGDPNRVQNARNQLLRYRQTNKDYSVFFAEFQRLSLEGEMATDASLATMLEFAVSDELKAIRVYTYAQNYYDPERTTCHPATCPTRKESYRKG